MYLNFKTFWFTRPDAMGWDGMGWDEMGLTTGNHNSSHWQEASTNDLPVHASWWRSHFTSWFLIASSKLEWFAPPFCPWFIQLAAFWWLFLLISINPMQCLISIRFLGIKSMNYSIRHLLMYLIQVNLPLDID